MDALVEKAHRYGLHVSLNLHRGPGYCINAGFREPFHLWTDREAQDAFAHHWNFWAKRYREFSNDEMSFDLLNEPAIRADPNDQHSKLSAVPADIYFKVAQRACQAIRSEKIKFILKKEGKMKK